MTMYNGERIGWRKNSYYDKVHQVVISSELLGITFEEIQGILYSAARKKYTKRILSECIRYKLAEIKDGKYYPIVKM